MNTALRLELPLRTFSKSVPCAGDADDVFIVACRLAIRNTLQAVIACTVAIILLAPSTNVGPA